MKALDCDILVQHQCRLRCYTQLENFPGQTPRTGRIPRVDFRSLHKRIHERFGAVGRAPCYSHRTLRCIHTAYLGCHRTHSTRLDGQVPRRLLKGDKTVAFRDPVERRKAEVRYRPP